MDLKIVNRVSQFPKIVDFEDLVEIRSGLFQLSFSYQKSVTRVQFWHSKFHVAPYLCRPKQCLVYEDKSVNKSTRSSRPPRIHETNMSRICPLGANTRKNRRKSLSHHDDDCNAYDMATEPQSIVPINL
jgi:hypothetical protein